MKKLNFFIIFLLFFFISNTSFSQNNYKDNVQSDISQYAGVYEGYLLDFSWCCDGPSTEFSNIVFYYDGISLKCLYDGIILNNLSLYDNVFKYKYEDFEGKIFGKFVTSNGEEGFLYFFEETDEHPEGSTSFLKKIGDAKMASEIYLNAENEFKEFKEFEKLFRKIFINKNEEELLSIMNFPFYDERESWENPVVYNNKKEVKVLLKTMFGTKLDESSFKYQNSNETFKDTYTIQGDKMFFYFKKIGSEFKLVYITDIVY